MTFEHDEIQDCWNVNDSEGMIGHISYFEDKWEFSPVSNYTYYIEDLEIIILKMKELNSNTEKP